MRPVSAQLYERSRHTYTSQRRRKRAIAHTVYDNYMRFVCFADEGFPPQSCSSIGYFSQSWGRVEGADTTTSIISKQAIFVLNTYWSLDSHRALFALIVLWRTWSTRTTFYDFCDFKPQSCISKRSLIWNALGWMNLCCFMRLWLMKT